MKLNHGPLEGVWKRRGLYPRIPNHNHKLKQVSNTVLAGHDVKRAIRIIPGSNVTRLVTLLTILILCLSIQADF